MANGTGTTDAEKLVQLGMLGNDIAMQWYVLTHQGTALPGPAPGGEINVPGLRASFNTNLLILGLIALGAFLLLGRK